MATKTDGGPAFSVAEIGTHGSYGMTLRDYFAAKALQGMLSDPTRVSRDGFKSDFAELAYGYADAMLEVRESKE